MAMHSNPYPSPPPAHLNGGDRLSRRLPAAGRFLAGVLTGLLAGAAAHANPDGPTVVHGSAHFAHPGANALDVTTSPNAIIHWQGFSIGAGEVTRFIQQSASSAVLNRVTGADPSAILGQLLSNGRVFLVNPHGIVFGEGAVVDTAGLVASTLGISDADFLAGRYRFDAGPDAGEVVNQGLIKAGADGVFLLAPSVENSGVVRTAGGDLVLAAGRRITLTSLDLDGVRVEVQAPEDEALNLGSLIAGRGAAGMFADSIRNAGTVEANAVTVGDDGVIRLVAREDLTLEAGGRVAAEGPSGGEVHVESERGTTWVSGEVSARASEGRGGSIRLLGDRVGLAGARIDASGPAGGGEVRIGGDVSGRGPTPTAEATYVSADSIVSADALASGDGGKVVVFAEGFANVQGRLSARGGPSGGAGGFVETSGRRSFAIRHAPDTTAPKGGGGHWLIDPHDIEIVAGRGNTNVPAADPFTSTGDSARLGIELLAAALSGGQSVTVQTAAGGTQGGDITLSTPADIDATTGTNTLTLQAHDHININAPVSDAVDGAELNLVLIAGDEIRFRADVTLRGGSLETRGGETNVTNHAVVTLDGIPWRVNDDEFLGIGIDGPGTVVARNGALIDASGNAILIGTYGSEHEGVGTLTIESGADVTARRVVVGDDAFSQGTVTVSGSDSSLTTGGADNEVRVGNEGTGTLEVLDGGYVDTLRVVIGDGVGSQGTVTVSGSGSILEGSDGALVVGNEGSGALTIENGADVGAGRAVIGDHAGSQGTVTVSGSGSILTTDGTDNEVRVGNEGTGTLEVLDGGYFRTLRVVIGDGVGSQGTVTVSGSDSILDGNALVVGNEGSGALTIESSATVGARRVVIGDDTDSQGTVTVSGSDSFLTTEGTDNEVRVGNEGTGTLEVLDGGQVSTLRVVIGDGVGSQGTVTVSGSDSILAGGDGNVLVVGNEGSGALTIENSATVGARRVVIGDDTGSQGTVTVSGSDSFLTTEGTDNEVRVGNEGTGTLEVLDGGQVRTLWFEVARSGVGRATIRGVAADGIRSAVIVSPANGKFSGDFVDEGGFARAGRNAGSRGAIEILEGGLLRVLDGEDTHGPEFQLARNKGSVGTLLIDGAGSSLELIQNGPAVRGDPNVFPGPTAQLGRRGSGTTTIRNGGRLLVRGEDALVRVSRDSVNPNYSDPDTGPIDQRSVVNVLSGGRMEVTGENARFVIGDSGPAADGVVTVSGPGSTITVTGEGNALVVGDEGTGALTIESGAGVSAARAVVGRKPGSRGTLRVRRGGALDAVTLLAVGKDFDFDHRTTREPGGTGSAVGEAGSRVEYDALEVGTHGSTNLRGAEEVLTEEQVTESTRTNTDEIVRVQEGAVPESAVDSGEPGDEGETREEEPAGEEDGEDEEDEGSEEEGEERSGAGESDEEEREELPMCPA